MQITCLHCQRVVEREGNHGSPPLFCSPQCKQRHHRIKRENKRKQVKVDAKKVCPHPEKLQFRREIKIKKYADSIGLKYYKCECGLWHLTSQGTVRRKALREMKRPYKVILWQNDMVMAFNKFGEQIRELQGPINPDLRNKVNQRADEQTTFWHGVWQTGVLAERTKETW